MKTSCSISWGVVWTRHDGSLSTGHANSAEDMISEDGWKTLDKADNMEKFEIYQFYEESSHQDWEARKAAIEESSNKKEEKKAKKGKKSEEVTSE